MRNIKLTLVNGDVINTKINGTEQDIINHYNDCNFLLNNKDEQVKEIEIEGNTQGLIGCSKRTIIYPFTYNQKAQCYLY